MAYITAGICQLCGNPRAFWWAGDIVTGVIDVRAAAGCSHCDLPFCDDCRDLFVSSQGEIFQRITPAQVNSDIDPT